VLGVGGKRAAIWGPGWGKEAVEGPRDQGPAEAKYWNWLVGSNGGQDGVVGGKEGPAQGMWPGHHARVGVQGGDCLVAYGWAMVQGTVQSLLDGREWIMVLVQVQEASIGWC